MRSVRSASWLLCVLLVSACSADSGATTDPAAQEPGSASTPAVPDAPDATTDAPGAEPESVPVPQSLRFTGTTVEGDRFEGATLAGKPAVLWFWAPWCHICKGQTPSVSALAEKYAGEVAIVGVAGLSEDPAGIAAFAADTSGIVNLTDSPGELWRRFGIVEQSVFTVLDADGKVVSEGFLRDDELNTLVASLVG